MILGIYFSILVKLCKLYLQTVKYKEFIPPCIGEIIQIFFAVVQICKKVAIFALEIHQDFIFVYQQLKCHHLGTVAFRYQNLHCMKTYGWHLYILFNI